MDFTTSGRDILAAGRTTGIDAVENEDDCDMDVVEEELGVSRVSSG